MKNPLIFIISLMIISCTSQNKIFTPQELAIINSENLILNLYTYDNEQENELLREKSNSFNKDEIKDLTLEKLKSKMLATVKNPEHPGVGIAAPQVGILRKLIAVQRFDKEDNPFEFYINPVIVAHSDSTVVSTEGCLSVPDKKGDVIRYASVKIEYLDNDKQIKQETINGFTAIIFQHEIDHLDGTLYIDKIVETIE
ncbi:MAG: peptide deformylase [Bacteroidales bacterium]|nr:peptide deformylase [Bacteroidales bacterium]